MSASAVAHGSHMHIHPGSIKDQSRSQSHVDATAGGGGGARSSSPPPFLTFVNPGESVRTPMLAAFPQSIPYARLSLHPSHQTPPDHSTVSASKEGLDADRQARPQQQQQQQQQMDEQLEKEFQLLYTPFALRKRREAEDVYTRTFLNTLQEETKDNELAFCFRESMAKVGSPFASVRVDGLREALWQIRSIGVCAAAEAQQSQMDGLATSRNGKANASPAPAGQVSDPLSGTQRYLSPQSQPLNTQQPLRPPQGASAPGSAPVPQPEEAFLLPFDAIRATMTGAMSASLPRASGSGVPYASETWDRAQRALAGSDLTSVLFRRALTPRSEVRAAMHMGGPVNVELSTEDALAWSSHRPPVELSPLEKLKLESKRAMMAKAGVGRQQQLEQQFQLPSSPVAIANGNASGNGNSGPTRRMTPCGFEAVVPETPIYAMMTETTYREQELALRLLQGMCLTVNYQRRCVAEGCFFHYATEVFQCFLQHVEAVFTQRRLMHHHLLSRYPSDPASGQRANTPHPPHSESGHGNRSLYVSSPLALGSGSFSPPNALSTRGSAGSANLPAVANASSTLRHAASSPSSSTTQLDSSPVEVEEDQVAVIVALIDAVEAACHYNPTGLTRLVQTGGVVAMLNLVYSPCVPESVRVAVLDTISVLLQEVAPFRRAIAAPSGANGDGQQQTKDVATANSETLVEDALLEIMLEQARTGTYSSPGARQNGGSPPFMMDRASASKFESAVREWSSKHGLSHAVTGIMELRNLKDWRRLRLAQQQQRASAAAAGGGAAASGGGPGGVGGGIPGAVVSAGGASIETTRDSKRATQQRAANIMALLQVIDGKRADLQ